MAFIGVSQYNHNQQIDEYEYDDADNFYDDGANYGNYLDVDDSEGKTNEIWHFFAHKSSELNEEFLYYSCADTEEASESEYGHTGRNPNEPLEIKEL